MTSFGRMLSNRSIKVVRIPDENNSCFPIIGERWSVRPSLSRPAKPRILEVCQIAFEELSRLPSTREPTDLSLTSQRRRDHQRNHRFPAAMPSETTSMVANGYHVITNKGLSSVQFVA